MAGIDVSTESPWVEGNLLASYIADHSGHVRDRASELLGKLDAAERVRLASLVPSLAEASFSNAREFELLGLADHDPRVQLAFAERLGCFARNEHAIYDIVVLLRVVADTPNLRSPRSPFIAGLRSVQHAAGPAYLRDVLERGSRPPRYRTDTQASDEERKRDRRIQASFVEATRHFAHVLKS